MSLPSVLEPVTQAARRHFADSFAEARGGFVQAAGATVRSYATASSGPDGSELFTDCAWIGDPDARTVLVLISGTHGIEGYSGSAVQRDWIAEHAAQWPHQAPAVLLVHALNPYGFAWDRRVTAEGCDLNRNFIDFANPPVNPDYAEIAELLVPSNLGEHEIERSEAQLARWRADKGELAFQIARKSGQCSDPKGMFYCGVAATEAHRTLDRIFTDYRLGKRDFVTVLDIHTGLGPYGYGEPQSEHDPASRSHAIARDVIGPSLTSPELGTSFSVPLHGTMQQFWDQRMADGRHLYLCLEFGTFDQESSRKLYREDHWYHGHGAGDPLSEYGLDLRRRMRAHFDPAEDSWREMVLMRTRQVIAQTLRHLAQVR